MNKQEFKDLLKESLREVLPGIVKQVLKEQLTPVIKAMINERKQHATTAPSYVTEIKRIVTQPKTQSKSMQSFRAPVNSSDPIKNMLAETFNNMLPDEYDDYQVPEGLPVELPSTQQPVAINPQLAPLMEGINPSVSLNQSAVSQGKSVLAALQPKAMGPISTEFNPEADLENIKIDNVPDFTALMSRRTFK